MKTIQTICLLASLWLPANKTQAQTTIVFSHDGNGKMLERKVQVMPQARMGKTSLPKDSARNELRLNVYPNPASTFLVVEGKLPGGVAKADLYLLNMSGQRVRSCIYNGLHIMLEVGGLPAGTYVLELEYNKNRHSAYKVIINP